MHITRDDVKWANNKLITDDIFPLNILNIYNDWFEKYHRKKDNGKTCYLLRLLSEANFQ